MEEVERYYTPTIEEFYVGFEFEFLDIEKENAEYEKQVYDIKLYLDKLEGSIKSQLRVKYLDKEDIESLGWKIDSRGDYSIGNVFITWHTGDVHPPWVEITREDGGFLFDGKLKNKSELKVLMKQLGI